MFMADNIRSIQYITSAALGVTRWSDVLKKVYTVGMAIATFGTGFSLGYMILRSLNFSTRPWRSSFEDPRSLIANWLLFAVFLVALPVGSTLIPFILGKSGDFNPDYQAWNSACMDPKYSTMLHIKYLAAIGNPFSMTMYARLDGTYYYLGLLPTTAPNEPNVMLSTPSFILNPTTNPIVSSLEAGQEMFSLTNTSTKDLIATLTLSTGQNNTHSILGKCIPSGANDNNFTTCVNGTLNSGAGESNNSVVANPFLRSIGPKITTLEIMYDPSSAAAEGVNGTFLRGYLDSWPGDLNWFMTGDVASDTAPNASLEESDADGTVIDADGVQVVSAPWPGCEGIKVCATSGLSGLIVSGWIWENLDRWMWYSPQDCMT